MEIAPGVRRIGTGVVNVYLVEEAGDVAVVDTGMPGDWSDLTAELAAMGRSLGDVRRVLLTHGHSDHLGFAERMRTEQQVPVWVHEADAALARGEVPNPAKCQPAAAVAAVRGALSAGASSRAGGYSPER